MTVRGSVANMNTRKNSSSSGRKSKYSIVERLQQGNFGISNWVNMIAYVHDNGVLYGLGGKTTHHEGNKRYCKIPNKDKHKIAKEIVEALRMLSPPG
mmetsp:Transcript_57856/g.69601  ORF Transcript_57856/g.69601 Transcript_57856/m.69601 type:complete len:97 (-) Transcript_57856:2076-2366(-)